MTHTTTEHLAATQSAHSKSRKDATASRQLRDLNSHTQPIQEALNHAQASVNRAMQLLQREYLQRRTQILAARDDWNEP